MLNWIIAASLRNRVIVLVLATAIAGFGLFTALRMPVDVLPDLNRPVVTIMTDIHGMVPRDVELLVTWPIEQVMNGATGVFRVRSTSSMGLSIVWVEFHWDMDIYLARQVVSEKLQLAQGKLPSSARPAMAPISSIMGQIQLIGFKSKIDKKSNAPRMSPTVLRRIVDRDIKPRIMSLSGIAQIVNIGGQPLELQVTVDGEKLKTFSVTLPEVEEAVRKANLNVSGGFMQLGTKGPLVRVAGLVREEKELAHAVVRSDPIRAVRVGDVADVALQPTAIPTGNAGVNGGPGVIMLIMKQPGVDTVDLTDRISRELSQIKKELPSDIVIIEDLFQQAAFIHRAIDNVLGAVRDGTILVVIILFMFLLNLRTTFITLMAIPMSVAIAALVFSACGLTINTMTLGGLAVAIGTLVDDAIVDVENVFRRLHENAGKGGKESVLRVIYLASSENWKPVMYGTLLVTVVYLPLFFLSGIEGKLFAPVGLAYIISVMASLLVALVLTPVTCYYLLGRYQNPQKEYGGRVVNFFKRKVGQVIHFSMAYPFQILAVVVALALCGTVIIFTRGSAFLPSFNEGTAQINLILPPDTNLATSDSYGLRLEKILLQVEGVLNVGRRTGRASGDEHALAVNWSEAIITFDPQIPRPREEILEEIRQRLTEEFPGVPVATDQPLSHLLSHLLSGVTAQVAIKIYGPNLAVLRTAANDAEAAIRPISGIRDLFVEPQVLIDQIEVKPRREALAAFGLSVEDVAETVELAVGGEEISRLQVGQISYPIVVRLAKKDRQNLDNLRNLYLRQEDGNLLLLSDVADVEVAPMANSINRENVQRRIVVQHNIAGRSLGEVVKDVNKALDPIRRRLGKMQGYAIRVSGQFEAQEEAAQVIFLLSIVAVAMMVLILYLHFRSFRLALLVLLSRPIALIGAGAYIFISNQVISVATLVGLIALLGISARNAILLVDHYLHLLRYEAESWSPEMIIRAGKERMVPILMTALTSGIGLVPLAMAPGQPGREILYPVATVIIGGLVTSTILDFLVTPGLFWVFGEKEAVRLSVEQGASELSLN